MLPAGFEPAISASERLQTHALAHHTNQYYKALHHQNVDQTLSELKFFCFLMCLQQGFTSILVLTSPMNNWRPVQSTVKFGSVLLAKSEFYPKSRLSTAFLNERLALSASSSSHPWDGFVYLICRGVSRNRCEHMAARFSRVIYTTILWSKNRI